MQGRILSTAVHLVLFLTASVGFVVSLAILGEDRSFVFAFGMVCVGQKNMRTHTHTRKESLSFSIASRHGHDHFCAFEEANVYWDDPPYYIVHSTYYGLLSKLCS